MSEQNAVHSMDADTITKIVGWIAAALGAIGTVAFRRRGREGVSDSRIKKLEDELAKMQALHQSVRIEIVEMSTNVEAITNRVQQIENRQSASHREVADTLNAMLQDMDGLRMRINGLVRRLADDK